MSRERQLLRQFFHFILISIGIPLLLFGGSMVYIGVYALSGPLEPMQATVLSMEVNEGYSDVTVQYSYKVGEREYQSSAIVEASEHKALFVGGEMGVFVSNSSPWFSSNTIPSKSKIIISGLSCAMLGLLLILKVVIRRRSIPTTERGAQVLPS